MFLHTGKMRVVLCNILRVVLLHKTEKKNDYIILVQQLLEHDDYYHVI